MSLLLIFVNVSNKDTLQLLWYNSLRISYYLRLNFIELNVSNKTAVLGLINISYDVGLNTLLYNSLLLY